MAAGPSLPSATGLVRAAIVVPLALTPAACGDSHEPRAGETSAVWSLEPEPVFQVGGVDAGPDQEFTEVIAAMRMYDDRIVVVDRRNVSVMLYDADGTLVRRVGRKGEGPGEYELIFSADRCRPGLITVYDWDQTAEVYDPELELVETVPRLAIPGLPDGVPAYRRACNAAGFRIATGWGDMEAEFAEGYFKRSAPLVLTRGEELVADLGPRLGSERIGFLGPDGNPTGSGPHPFGRQTSVALGSKRAYAGDAAGYRVEVFDLSGQLVDTLTWTGPDVAWSDELMATYAAERIEATPEERRPEMRRYLGDMPVLDQLPAYDQLLVDRADRLWVRHFVRPGATEIGWVVFDPSGREAGRIALPAGSELLEAGENYLILSVTDEFDVPTVRMHRLRVPA